jgi:hypothetical protein
MLWSSESSVSFGISHQNLVHFSLLSHASHMLCPSHSSWLYLPNDIWGWVQIMKPLIVQLPECMENGKNIQARVTSFKQYISAIASKKLI